MLHPGILISSKNVLNSNTGNLRLRLQGPREKIDWTNQFPIILARKFSFEVGTSLNRFMVPGVWGECSGLPEPGAFADTQEEPKQTNKICHQKNQLKQDPGEPSSGDNLNYYTGALLQEQAADCEALGTATLQEKPKVEKAGRNLCDTCGKRTIRQKKSSKFLPVNSAVLSQWQSDYPRKRSRNEQRPEAGEEQSPEAGDEQSQTCSRDSPSSAGSITFSVNFSKSSSFTVSLLS